MAGMTFEQLREVVNANRSRFEESFQETQPRKDYPITRLAMQHAKSEDLQHTIEWTIRRKAASGSIQSIRAYEDAEGVRDEYDVVAQIKPTAFLSHKEMVFSIRATLAMKNAKTKLWDDYKMKRSSAEENWHEHWETAIFSNAATSNLAESFAGWLYWLPRSMTSGGVYTAQPTPARNGVYTVLGDGSVTSTAGGIDRSAAANSRLRGLVGTHNSKLDVNLLNAIQNAVIDSGFKYIPTLEGTKPAMSPLTIVWDESFDREYGRLLNNHNGPKSGDFFNVGAKRIDGAETVAAEVLNNHAIRPIFGIRHSNLHLIKFKQDWNREIDKEDGIDRLNKFRSWSAQTRALEASTAGFLIHGSFATGT